MGAQDADTIVEQITPTLVEEFRRRGHYRHQYADTAQRDLLVKAARQAAAELDRPLETFDRDGGLHLVIADWGEPPLEAQLDDTRTRNAIDRAFTDPTT